jgi:hypothetical protein
MRAASRAEGMTATAPESAIRRSTAFGLDVAARSILVRAL